MPASRSCRACTAPLPTDLRACTGCGAPVTEFAARAPVHEGIVFEPRIERRVYSRWRSGPTSFGPLGRILATAGLVMLLPLVQPKVVALVVAGVILVALLALTWNSADDWQRFFLVAPALMIPVGFLMTWLAGL